MTIFTSQIVTISACKCHMYKLQVSQFWECFAICQKGEWCQHTCSVSRLFLWYSLSRTWRFCVPVNQKAAWKIHVHTAMYAHMHIIATNGTLVCLLLLVCYVITHSDSPHKLKVHYTIRVMTWHDTTENMSTHQLPIPSEWHTQVSLMILTLKQCCKPKSPCQHMISYPSTF